MMTKTDAHVQLVNRDGEGAALVYVNDHHDRAIALYEGAYVMLDKTAEGWDLSGEPARGEESILLQTLLAPTNDTTVTTVTKDDAAEVPELPEAPEAPEEA